MYRRVTLLILVAILALYVGVGCNKQEIADLKAEVDRKDSTILNMSTEAANQREVLFQKTTAQTFLTYERDSLAAALQKKSEENARLQTMIAKVEKKAKQDLQEFAEATVVFHDRQAACEATSDTLRHELASLRAANDTCSMALSTCDQYSTNIYQWKEYYERESHRSWWKKLWGAGKNTPPPFPDPTQEILL